MDWLLAPTDRRAKAAVLAGALPLGVVARLHAAAHDTELVEHGVVLDAHERVHEGVSEPGHVNRSRHTVLLEAGGSYHGALS